MAARSPGDHGSGHSGWEPELDLLQATASDVVSAASVLGLAPELSYWSGIVRDGTGWTCALLRPIDVARAPGRGRLVLQTTDGALPLRTDAAGDAAASSAGVVVAQGPTGATLSSRPGAPGAAFRIETEGRAIAWSEGAARSELRGDAVGHAAFGHRGRGYAVVNDGTCNRVCTTDVDGAVTTADDGYWPTRVAFTIAGEPWEWLVAPADRMVDLGPMPNPQAAGRMRQVGDDRAPRAWFAWGETHPAHGDRRVPGD